MPLINHRPYAQKIERSVLYKKFFDEKRRASQNHASRSWGHDFAKQTTQAITQEIIKEHRLTSLSIDTTNPTVKVLSQLGEKIHVSVFCKVPIQLRAIVEGSQGMYNLEYNYGEGYASKDFTKLSFDVEEKSKDVAVECIRLQFIELERIFEELNRIIEEYNIALAEETAEIIENKKSELDSKQQLEAELTSLLQKTHCLDA